VSDGQRNAALVEIKYHVDVAASTRHVWEPPHICSLTLLLGWPCIVQLAKRLRRHAHGPPRCVGVDNPPLIHAASIAVGLQAVAGSTLLSLEQVVL
jgi:hypothetical protein